MSFEVTLENLIRVIRKSQGFSDTTVIMPTSLLEDDIGITGDDGCDLLNDVEKEFGISFTGQDRTIRGVFGMKEGEYLFHGEGIDLFGFIRSLVGKDSENIKPITVAQLYEAICLAKEKNHA